MSRLCELIGQYGVQVSETKELAPTTEFANELKRVEKAAEEYDKLVAWLNSNTTFYDTAESNAPVLASVSTRIWYHATDDQESYPFSEVANRHRDAREQSKEK